MTEREVICAAIAAVLAALVGRGPWWWIGASLVLFALVLEQPRLLILAVALLVGARAQETESARVGAPRGVLVGQAIVQTDPVEQFVGLRFEADLHGARYLVEVPPDLARPVRTVLAGQTMNLTCRVEQLRGRWEWVASRHLSGSCVVSRISDLGPGSWLADSANRIRKLVDTSLSSLEPEDAALFAGIVFGDDRNQSELERARFRGSGLAHLTAVSGQNLAFALVVVTPLLRRLSLGPKWIVTLVVLVWFGVLTRFEPSVVRAIAMAAVAATGSFRGRLVTPRRRLAVAIIGLLILDPMIVWSVGFQLSLAACLGIVELRRPLDSVLRNQIRLPKWCAEPAAIAIAAQVATIPLLIPLAHTQPAMGVFANLAAVPVAGLLMMWGMVAAPLGGVSGQLCASVLSWPSMLAVRWLRLVATIGSRGEWPRHHQWWALSICCFVGAVLHAQRVSKGSHWTRLGRRVHLRLAMVGVLVAGAASLWDVAVVSPPPIHGSANAQLLISEAGAVLVLGPRASEREVLDLAMSRDGQRIDVVILLGGGKRNGGILVSLRQFRTVGQVMASDASIIADSTQLSPGPLRFGTLRMLVSKSRAGAAHRIDSRQVAALGRVEGSGGWSLQLETPVG